MVCGRGKAPARIRYAYKMMYEIIKYLRYGATADRGYALLLTHERAISYSRDSRFSRGN